MKHLSMHSDIKKMVSIQIDINRSVWAANGETTKGAFTNESERNAYIKKCIDSASKTINILKNKL